MDSYTIILWEYWIFDIVQIIRDNRDMRLDEMHYARRRKNVKQIPNNIIIYYIKALEWNSKNYYTHVQ